MPQLVSCNPIKTQLANEYNKAIDHISSEKEVPVMRNYYFQLRNIDPGMSQLIPINLAIKQAIEVVLAYYTYRKPRHA